MFERFTERARHVVVLAQEEGRSLRHHYIGTEHILLGLTSEDEGVAFPTRPDLGSDREEHEGVAVRVCMTSARTQKRSATR